ncbi:unnamed protein product [Linum trigynum]|uniref:Uncharacterized protein n=1 Tax=Linum trigynum TaxID=586398 RepID=A0AAV2D3Z1_9ROSI
MLYIDTHHLQALFRVWSAAAGDLVARDDSLFCAKSVFPQNEAFVVRLPVRSRQCSLAARALSMPATTRRFVFNASAIARLKRRNANQ